MQEKNKLFCHWDFVRFVSEENLKQNDGTSLTLSVTDGKLELMIFLGKDDFDSGYEVRVYKNKNSDKYVPNEEDNIKKYEEKDEYDTFFFDEYEEANKFLSMIGYIHPEYKIRPTRQRNN